MLRAQNKTAYIEKQFVDTVLGEMPYRILFPKEYDVLKKYPLILILHGSGERGNDNESQLIHGASLFLKEEIRASYPAIVVFPQCAKEDYWSNVLTKVNNEGERTFNFPLEGSPTNAMKLVEKLTKSIIEQYNADKNRIYVGGLSMGGMGTFEIVKRNPELFAAAFPICGGGNPKTAEKLSRVNWWIFHGDKDQVVPHELSVMMSKAIKEAKGTVKFTSYPDTGHDSWTAAFAEPNLLPWLFSQKNK